MSYTLIIGELIEEEYDDDYIVETAEFVKLENAPADGSPTDYTNERMPSYVGWELFAEACAPLGLYDLLKPGGELLPEDADYVILTKFHKEKIDTGYVSKEILPPEHLNRLEWLKFWTDWALENCKTPVFANS